MWDLGCLVFLWSIVGVVVWQIEVWVIKGSKRVCGGLGIGLVGASFGSKEHVNIIAEFSKQHIDCVQHLCLQSKCGGET